MELFFWIYIGVVFLLWLASWLVSCKLSSVPKIEVGAPKPLVKISVIIPARNEEANLSRLLPSLQGQEFTPHEIIVVDDQSTDFTAKVAKDNGARVIAGTTPPDGWMGKPWACQQGANQATGDWFLFLDADTVLEEAGLFNLGYLAREADAVHSVCPYHKVKDPYEQLSAFFNVIMVLGMNAFTWKGKAAEEIGLFGQAMFLSKTNYYLCGGHKTVRAEVLENFHFARFVEAQGLERRCYLGKGTISMRMFPDGLEDLIDGWGKGFVSGASNTPKSAIIGISVWLSALIMIAMSLTFQPFASTAVAWAVSGLYLLGVLQSLYLFRRVGSYSVLTALFFPIPLCFYQGLFFRAVRRKKRGGTVKWKGRDVG